MRAPFSPSSEMSEGGPSHSSWHRGRTAVAIRCAPIGYWSATRIPIDTACRAPCDGPELAKLTAWTSFEGSLPTEEAALVLLFGLIADGQIRLRRVDGWRQIPAVLRQGRRPAA
jgi:hypothetical protein